MKTEGRHAALYAEVQESFRDNLVKAIRVGGGIAEDGRPKNIGKGELADISGLSSGTITKLTSQDFEEAKPDLEMLCKLGQALNVSPAFLLMTPRDWSVLAQAFGTIQSITNDTGESEESLVALLRDAAAKSKVDESVQGGLAFIRQLRGDDYTSKDRARQARGILSMTAMAQGALRRDVANSKMFATALGAFLGDREVGTN